MNEKQHLLVVKGDIRVVISVVTCRASSCTVTCQTFNETTETQACKWPDLNTVQCSDLQDLESVTSAT